MGIDLQHFSATGEFMKTLSLSANGSDCTGFLGARVVGFFASPFIGLLDVVIHTALAVLKLIPALILTPYNFIARCFDSSHLVPDEYVMGSVLLHIFIVFKTIVFIPIISITAFFNPELARQNADIKLIFA